MKTCPKCMKQIEDDCIVCPHCFMDLTPQKESEAERKIRRSAEKRRTTKEAAGCFAVPLVPIIIIIIIIVILILLGL